MLHSTKTPSNYQASQRSTERTASEGAIIMLDSVGAHKDFAATEKCRAISLRLPHENQNGLSQIAPAVEALAYDLGCELETKHRIGEQFIPFIIKISNVQIILRFYNDSSDFLLHDQQLRGAVRVQNKIYESLGFKVLGFRKSLFSYNPLNERVDLLREAILKSEKDLVA